MRLLLPFEATSDDSTYLAPWPPYTFSRGDELSRGWRHWRSNFSEYVAVRVRCARCGTPLAMFGRSCRPPADPRAVLFAVLHGAELAFDDLDEPTRVILYCGTKRKGTRCTGESQHRLDRIADRLAGMRSEVGPDTLLPVVDDVRD